MPAALNSLVMRLGLTCLGGLLVLQLAFLAIMIWPNGQPALYRLVPPDEAAAMAAALEAAPAPARPVIVRALNTPRQIVSLLPAFPETRAGLAVPASSRNQVFFAEYRSRLAGRPFEVQQRGGRAWAAILRGEVGAPGSIRLLVQLEGGQVMTIERAPVVLQTLFARLSTIAAAGSAVLLAMMAVCYLQMVRPINRLAGQTAALAVDGQGPDLPETGPAEIRRLATCLNEMRGRIRNLVETRTRELAAIAHDLRTYLTRLRLRAEFISDPSERDAAVRDLEEMSLLLDDTLLFASHVHAGISQAEAVDLAAELENLAGVRREAGQSVWAQTLVDAPHALCAPSALRRILSNLVDNAVRYGGAAHLRLEVAEEMLRIVVEDEGPGVPEASLARLTEPFERLEPSRGRDTGGAGLGLAIVKSLAASQGGRLEIGPGRPKGLRVVVHLQRADRASRQALEPATDRSGRDV